MIQIWQGRLFGIGNLRAIDENNSVKSNGAIAGTLRSEYPDTTRSFFPSACLRNCGTAQCNAALRYGLKAGRRAVK
jgi:hypothetical protein